MTSYFRFVTLLAALALAGCGDDSTGQSRGGWGGAVKVVTQRVEMQPLIDEIEALGTARANESIEIQPRISSLIERIYFEEGQLVNEGDLLIDLENSEIVAGLAVAKAALSESRSLYDRSKSLADTQAISASNLEQLLAQVKVDEAQVQAAQARLDNTSIRAPFRGRIGLRRVSPGSYVTSSTVITTLDDVSEIKLDFSVPETFLRVRPKHRYSPGSGIAVGPSPGSSSQSGHCAQARHVSYGGPAARSWRRVARTGTGDRP
jgi:membrane fusion protein (multidrug efflux system)